MASITSISLIVRNSKFQVADKIYYRLVTDLNIIVLVACHCKTALEVCEIQTQLDKWLILHNNTCSSGQFVVRRSSSSSVRSWWYILTAEQYSVKMSCAESSWFIVVCIWMRIYGLILSCLLSYITRYRWRAAAALRGGVTIRIIIRWLKYKSK